MLLASMLLASMLFASMLFASMLFASMLLASMRFASMLFGGPHLHADHEVHRAAQPQDGHRGGGVGEHTARAVDAAVALELEQAAHRRAPVAAAAAVGLAPLERGPRLLELAQVALVVLVGESDEAAQRLARLLTLGGCGSGLGRAVRAE